VKRLGPAQAPIAFRKPASTIEDLQAVAGLTELRFLGISNSGGISSLQPVGELALLECLHAWGSTRIEDGDLSPLLRLSHLSEIRMQDRREYRPRLAEVKQQLDCD
jgi:hypothetical protein